MARPKTPIDWNEFDKLCAMQCTQQEIAAWFNCTDDTIQNRCKAEKKMGFSDYYKQKSAHGKISLRRSQFQMAQKNVAMAIWLGKQYLGQKDKHEVKQDTTITKPTSTEMDLNERAKQLEVA